MKITGICIQAGDDKDDTCRMILSCEHGDVILWNMIRDDLINMPNIMYKKIKVTIELDDEN